MDNLWNKEDIKLKLRYYLLPQALVSLFICFYPAYINDLFKLMYVHTGWDFFTTIGLSQVIVISLCTCVLAYFSYAKTGIFLLKAPEKKWQQRIALFVIPFFVGCLTMAAVKQHIDHAKIRNYTISNIGELRNIHDSTEIYHIEYYNILYDEYFYVENVEDVNIGTSKHPRYVTEVSTSVVCPVLINFSTEYDLRKQKIWIGFTIAKRFKDQFSFDSPLIANAAYENLVRLHGQHDIIYFSETLDQTYLYLIKEKLEINNIPYNKPIILQAHYSPYEPYDGYKYALIALCCFLGGNVFITIITLTKYVDQDKKKQLIHTNFSTKNYVKK